MNLDPSESLNDAELWTALEIAQLKNVVTDLQDALGRSHSLLYLIPTFSICSTSHKVSYKVVFFRHLQHK